MVLLQFSTCFLLAGTKQCTPFLKRQQWVEDSIRKSLINMPPLPFKIRDQYNDDKDHNAGSQQDLFLISFCVMVGLFHSSRLNGFYE